MINVYIYCEGLTEESFINQVLYPYFISRGISVIPIICTTKRKNGKKFKGGVSNFNKVKDELKKLCKQHRNEFVTTMFDYYGMPTNTPGISNNKVDVQSRVKGIEQAINDEIAQSNCKFHLMLHEFESILFTSPEAFRAIANDEIVGKIKEIRDSFATPEEINNSRETAPSKRLQQLIPGYTKILDGTTVAREIGIESMMRECPHFGKWIRDIIEWTGA